MTEDWTPQAGDRVALATECEHGPDPGRVGTVIDASAVDPDGRAMAAVDFPFADHVVVVPHTSLEHVPGEAPELPPALVDAAQRLAGRLHGAGVNVLLGGALGVAAQAAEDVAPPEGVERHQFKGRTDRPCTECGTPDRNPVHHVTPDYRLRYLDDLSTGDRLWIGDRPHAWTEATILDKREADGNVWLIVVDSDGDQRGIAAHRFTTLPVPL